MNWGKGEFNYATPSPRNQQQNQLHLGELISLNENRVILTEGNKIYYHCYPRSDSETCLFSRCRVLFSIFFSPIRILQRAFVYICIHIQVTLLIPKSSFLFAAYPNKLLTRSNSHNLQSLNISHNVCIFLCNHKRISCKRC